MQRCSTAVTQLDIIHLQVIYRTKEQTSRTHQEIRTVETHDTELSKATFNLFSNGNMYNNNNFQVICDILPKEDTFMLKSWTGLSVSSS